MLILVEGISSKMNSEFLLFYFSVFGKTMENTRDYRHIDLVATEAQADKLTKKPSYRAHHVFHDNLIAVERYQTSVKMDKPIYTGTYSIQKIFKKGKVKIT